MKGDANERAADTGGPLVHVSQKRLQSNHRTPLAGVARRRRGAGRNRTGDWEFCRLLPYHLATAPKSLQSSAIAGSSQANGSFEMPLTADLVRLRQPRRNLFIELTRLRNPHQVRMGVWIDRLYPPKARA